jgi:hypothetical protein
MMLDNKARPDDRFILAIKRNIEKFRVAGNIRATELYEDFLNNQLERRKLDAEMKAIVSKPIPEEDQRRQLIELLPKQKANHKKLAEIVEALKLAGA